MTKIIIGHIIGMIPPLFFFRNIHIQGDSSLERTMTYVAMLALLAFMEYQLYRSIKIGTIYFRGQVDECDGSQFTSCQMGYSFLSGFCVIIVLQNLFL